MNIAMKYSQGAVAVRFAVVSLVWLCFVKDAHSSFASYNLESPCPEVFQFQEEAGGLVGYLQILYPKQHVNKVEVEFSYVSYNSDKTDGRLSLLEGDEKITRDIVNGNPVYYKLMFPQWLRPPKITKIYKNGQLICVGPTSGVYSGQTTRTVVHKSEFKIAGALVNSFPDKPDHLRPIKVPVFGVASHRPPPPPLKPTPPPYIPRPETAMPISTESEINLPSRIHIPDLVVTTHKPTKPPTQQKLPSDKVDEVCGKSLQLNTLIFGGKQLKKGKYPWLSVMYVRKKHGWDFQCVATLISKKHVLTAAHCTEFVGDKLLQAEDIVLALGLHDLRYFSTEADSINVLVREIILHPDYRYGTGDGDIAVLELEENVQFTIQIRPICLWPDDFGTSTIILENQKGAVAGWGLDESLEISSVPKETVQPVVSNAVCLNASNAFRAMTSERTFCAGARDNTGPCNGDSGTGFMMYKSSTWYLRGLVSISLKNKNTGDCDLSNYVVYTDVAKYKPWIKHVTGYNFK